MLVNGLAGGKFASPKIIVKRIEDHLYGRLPTYDGSDEREAQES